MSARRLARSADAPPQAASLAQRRSPDIERGVVPIGAGREFAELHARLVARGYIEFRQLLADAFGGYKAALMLGHALYWTRNWIRQQPGRGGWFWKTAAEWTEATGLTPREQERARAALRDSGVWQEQLAGAPAKLHFRVDVEALCLKLGSQDITGLDEQARDDRLIHLLGAPIMFFRPLADIAGGVSAGLLLSYLLESYRTAVLKRSVDPNGFFPVSLEGARIALNLGVKAQRNAREALSRAGLVRDAATQEQRPRLLMRLNLEAILACVCGQAEPRRRARKHAEPRLGAIEPAPVQRSLLDGRTHGESLRSGVMRVVRLLEAGGQSAQPAAPKPLRRLLDVAPVGIATLPAVDAADGGNRHSRVALLSKQQALSGAEGCPFVETRHALLSNLYKQKEVAKTTTTARVGTEPSCAGPGGRGRTMDLPFETRSDAVDGGVSAQPAETADPLAGLRHLVLPEQLDRALHNNALRIVRAAPEGDRQPLLDELAGHLAMPGKTVANPLAWLRSLSARAAQGDVILTLAPAVAAARARGQQHELALRRAGAQAPVAGATQEASAAVREQIARIRKSRDELALRSGQRVARRVQPSDGGSASCANACGARGDAECATEPAEGGGRMHAAADGGAS